MSDCQRCGAKASDAFLCRSCVTLTGRLLADLPWWLDRLTETALGQSRMADNGGRRSARRRDLDGDTELAACIEALPDKGLTGDDDALELEVARVRRQDAALAHALTAGGINARASLLLGRIADDLSHWVRVLCEDRGIPAPALRPGPALGSTAALWLAHHAQAIALSPEAGDISGDIEAHQDDIVAAVNRPEHPQYIGPCPTWDDDTQAECGRRLTAMPDAIETHCRGCKTTHSVARLQLAGMDAARRRTLTWEELLGVNRRQEDGWRVPERTLRHWRLVGRLRASAWIRAASGRTTPTRHAEDDVPLYRWGDVEMLRVRCDTPM